MASCPCVSGGGEIVLRTSLRPARGRRFQSPTPLPLKRPQETYIAWVCHSSPLVAPLHHEGFLLRPLSENKTPEAWWQTRFKQEKLIQGDCSAVASEAASYFDRHHQRLG